jgi:hypothetical protein
MLGNDLGWSGVPQMFKNFVYENHAELKDCALAPPKKIDL